MAQKLLAWSLIALCFLSPRADAETGLRAERAAFAWTLIDDRGAILVDLRDRRPFEREHLSGAINLPLADIVSGDLDLGDHKTRFFVLYGEEDFGIGDVQALMVKKGYTNSFYGGSYREMAQNRPAADVGVWPQPAN